MVTETEQTVTGDTNQDWTAAIEQSETLEGGTESGDDAQAIAEQEVPESAPAPEIVTEPTPVAVQTPTAPSAKEARLLEENTRLTKAADDANIERLALEWAQNRTNEYIQQGWDEQHARQMAVAETRTGLAEHKNLSATRRLVALQENVPVEVLAAVQDEAAMRQKAQEHKQMAGPQREELESVKRELAEFKAEVRKSRVPAQNYDQPSGASGSKSDIDIWNQSGRDGVWNPEVQKAGTRLGFL